LDFVLQVVGKIMPGRRGDQKAGFFNSLLADSIVNAQRGMAQRERRRADKQGRETGLKK
jgi:hypothetical protein